MKRWIPLFLVLGLQAQSIDVKTLWRPAPLDGVWRQSTGDDQRFAAPEFDDSNWTPVQLPAAGPISSPGTTWLRVRIRLPQPLPAEPRAILVPPISGRYELFVNGRIAGRFGDDELGLIPVSMIYRLPNDPDLTIALRNRQALGFLAYLTDFQQSFWIAAPEALKWKAREIELERRWRALPQLLMMAASCMAGLFFLVIPLWRADSREYLWCGLVMVGAVVLRLAQSTPWVFSSGLRQASLFTFALAIPYLLAWERLFESLFQQKLSGVVRAVRSALSVVTVIIVLDVLRETPGSSRLWSSYAVLFQCTLALIYADLAWRGRRWPDTSLMHLAVGLNLGANLVFYSVQVLRWVGLVPVAAQDRIALHALELRVLGMLGFALVMAVLLNRRSARLHSEQQRLRQELAAGAEMQTLLLHQALPDDMTAVYLPASEVGGDFYQAFATPSGTLVLVGDVSGKGLKAAMTVAAIVGALRHRRCHTPADVLAELNGVLLGASGFVTCCCVLVEPDQVRIATAGHPAPYLDGVEFAGPGGLPLGLAADATYTESSASRPSILTLVSDGVVEAENAQRELFGFARTREISGRTAQEIAEAAKAWGQTDDITVVTVRGMA